MIGITGSSGFVGQSIINYFGETNDFYKINRKIDIECKLDVILHCAGKAHDLKKTLNVDEYYEINTELTKRIFDFFLASDTSVFIFISSVKAIADHVEYELSEDADPQPETAYGKSKLLAERYILSKKIPLGKRVYILRPCMIHGPSNKGNLNLLYNIINKGYPWPLGKFVNARSYCSIENLCFIIKELIIRKDIQSDTFNIADNETISTNEIIYLISKSIQKSPKIFYINKKIILILARIGDFLKLPLNSERLQKLTESYIVSNKKILNSLGKPLPISARDGLIYTFNSFKKY